MTRANLVCSINGDTLTIQLEAQSASSGFYQTFSRWRESAVVAVSASISSSLVSRLSLSSIVPVSVSVTACVSVSVSVAAGPLSARGESLNTLEARLLSPPTTWHEAPKCHEVGRAEQLRPSLSLPLPHTGPGSRGVPDLLWNPLIFRDADMCAAPASQLNIWTK